LIEGVVQNWGTHPYTLGVYSYPKVGTYTTANDSSRLDLQVPVADNRIFFAGEGSHNTHPATVVGALHEGQRAANEVVAFNGNPNNPPPLPGSGGGNDGGGGSNDGGKSGGGGGTPSPALLLGLFLAVVRRRFLAQITA
jgi:hypothetical protein